MRVRGRGAPALACMHLGNFPVGGSFQGFRRVCVLREKSIHSFFQHPGLAHLATTGEDPTVLEANQESCN